MVGRFTLPSLPNFPTAVLDFIDTSPPVFYPPSRPSRPSSVSASAPPSCPSSPRAQQHRPLLPDVQLSLPPFSPTAHPHTDAPLRSSRRDAHARPRSQSALPPATATAMPSTGAVSCRPPPDWRSSRRQSIEQSVPTQPPRPGHRRSQSAAPLPVMTRGRPLDHSHRNSISSASALSLPTLDEDDGHGPQPTVHFPVAPSPVGGSFAWLEPAPRGRHTPSPGPVPDRGTPGRRRAQSSVSMTSAPAPQSARSSGTRSHRSSISFSMTRSSYSRKGSISSMSDLGYTTGNHAAPSRVSASVSVSDIAALATWSQEPMAPPPRTSSRGATLTKSPAETLRARLRSLSELEMSGAPASPQQCTTPTLPHPLSPATPRSTRATPGHTPGSATPTTSSHSHHIPQSPTPTRRAHTSLLTSHRHTHSMPDAASHLVPDSHRSPSRPTTSRLRQPVQLTMAVDVPPNGATSLSRRGSNRSTLETPGSPPLGSSPGSLVSDNGSSSPTTSVESLALGPALRDINLNLRELSLRDAPPPRDLCLRDTSLRDLNLREMQQVRSRRGSKASLERWRSTERHSRVMVSVIDDSVDSERFLDFDDI